MINYREMPRGVLLINIIQLFSTVGYAALMGLLNFYLTQHIGMAQSEANTLTASFFAINFLYHFLGGAVGGRYISFRGLFFISLALQFMGLLLIAINNHSIVLVGMATFITGSGLNVSCINMMLTQLFKPNDNKRRQAFAVNYSFMNIGFLITFLIAGYLQGQNQYAPTFIFAAVCMIIAMGLHLGLWKHVNDKDTTYSLIFFNSPKKFFYTPIIVIACLVFALFLMHYPNIGSWVVNISFISMVIYLIKFAFQQQIEYRIKIFTYMILMVGTMLFACVQGLQSTALENFVEYNTNKSLFGIEMQPATINMFENLGVIIFGFVFAVLMKNSKVETAPATYVTRGLLSYVLAFLMIPLGVFLSNSYGLSSVIFPILLLLIVAAGEIQVNPVNYAMAGEMLKPQHQGLFTGYLFLNVAFGINLSGPISNYALASESSNQTNPLMTNHLYSEIFYVMALAALVIAILFYFSIKAVNKTSIKTK